MCVTLSHCGSQKLAISLMLSVNDRYLPIFQPNILERKYFDICTIDYLTMCYDVCFENDNVYYIQYGIFFD